MKLSHRTSSRSMGQALRQETVRKTADERRALLAALKRQEQALESALNDVRAALKPLADHYPLAQV